MEESNVDPEPPDADIVETDPSRRYVRVSYILF